MHLCTKLIIVGYLLKLFTYVVFLAFAVLMVFSCANPVSPSGGPVDKEPPEVLSSDPPNFSVHFDKKRIQIVFNEFVKLNQPNQQVIVSPPLQKMPQFRIRGKSVVIDIEEELFENTTYSIFFGNAIVDITEGNPLVNYLYVFSTGNYIDSLSVAGEVVNAFNLEPEEGVFVMLHSTRNDTVPADSLPMLVRPLYVSKTNEQGQFRLRYLRDEPLKIFVLDDLNSNYLYDLPEEAIAFSDSLIVPEPEMQMEITTEKDTVPENGNDIPPENGNDTVPESGNDTLAVKDMYENYYRLRMFTEVDSAQRLLGTDVFMPPGFLLAFTFPTDSLSMELLDPQVSDDWKVEEWNPRRDSLRVWVTLPEPDTLDLILSDGNAFRDTVSIAFPVKEQEENQRRRPSDDEEEVIERLVIKTNAKGRSMDYGVPFRLIFDNPMTGWDFSDVRMIAGDDTMTGAPFVPVDSIRRRFLLDIEPEADTRYDFVFPDSTLFDIYGLTNDSVRMAFRTKKPEDYGNLIVDLQIEDETHPLIIQLLDNKENVLKEKYVLSGGEIRFDLLNPGFYKLKAIMDKRTNRRWDTGDYIQQLQPEKVMFYPAELQIRANWDVEETWVISE